MNLNRFSQAALKAAMIGSEVLCRYFNRPVHISYKGAINPVTEADRISQSKIIDVIRSAFPDHGILSEEEGGSIERWEYRWIIDPLDGTVNFIHHIPIFSISIALMHKGEVIASVVHAPLLKETFLAQKGAGAWCNGKRIRVSAVDEPVKSLLVTGFPYYIHSRPRRIIENLVKVTRKVQGMRRLGSAALDLAYVAAGRFEAFWEEGLSPWDVAAGSLLVTEAGGKITDFRNANNYIWGKNLLASNGILHAEILKLVS